MVNFVLRLNRRFATIFGSSCDIVPRIPAKSPEENKSDTELSLARYIIARIDRVPGFERS